MNLINTFIVWIWLLGISLIIPITLPAGGAQRSTIQIRENNIGSPLITLQKVNLLSSANSNSSILTTIKAGSPINVLKVWDSTDGERWLLVNVLNQNFYQLFDKRGWVNIRET